MSLRGAIDARLHPHGRLSPEDLETWTAEIPFARRATMTRGRFMREGR